MAKKIIIDTDPAMGTKGGDPEDCFAIMLAMNSPEVEILGITLSLIHISEPTRPY